MKSINALRFGLTAAAIALVISLGGNATAQPTLGEPGSVLIFPLFDSRPASATLVTVTNTNRILVPCPGDGSLATGTVNAHYVYQGSNQEDIDDGDAHWQEFDRDELLTPNDTISVLASRHNPENEIGFLYVVAEDPDTRDRRNFNFLIGSAYIANASLDLMWSYMPYSFKALREDPTDLDTCGFFVASEDGRIHFDGVHYAKFPDELFLDSFIEELNGVSNELVLMSTAGAFFRNDVDLLFYNNREQPFSRTMRFVC